MADGLNSVHLLGNVGNAPTLRRTNEGTAILTFSIATNESYLDRNKERCERTEWHNIAVWGKRGEALAKLLHSGSQVFIDGSLRTSSWEQDGQKQYRTEVVASNVILCGSRRTQDGAAEDDHEG